MMDSPRDQLMVEIAKSLEFVLQALVDSPALEDLSRLRVLQHIGRLQATREIFEQRGAP